VGTLLDIRTGLAANLGTIDAMQVNDNGYINASPTPPSAEFFPGGPAGSIVYDRAMGRGLDVTPFTVRVYVSLVSDVGAQVNLDEYIEPSGTRSVKAALESDTTLGGAANDIHVVSCTGYQQFVFEGRPPLLGAEWHVDVYATGT
jgi:hypothetical protein